MTDINNKRVVVGCEESQTVAIAFRNLGIEAYSCDIQPCSGGHPEWHIQGDVFEAIKEVKPKLFIGHPPCTFISYVGNRWFNVEKYGENAILRAKYRDEGIDFFMRLWNIDVPHICLENPRGYIQKVLKPTQTIQPYYFGDICSKTTLLWLKNIPPYTIIKHLICLTKKLHTFIKERCVNRGVQNFLGRIYCPFLKKSVLKYAQKHSPELQTLWQLNGVNYFD